MYIIKRKPKPPLSGIGSTLSLLLPVAVVGYILWKFATSKDTGGNRDYSTKDW